MITYPQQVMFCNKFMTRSSSFIKGRLLIKLMIRFFTYCQYNWNELKNGLCLARENKTFKIFELAQVKKYSPFKEAVCFFFNYFQCSVFTSYLVCPRSTETVWYLTKELGTTNPKSATHKTIKAKNSSNWYSVRSPGLLLLEDIPRDLKLLRGRLTFIVATSNGSVRFIA